MRFLVRAALIAVSAVVGGFLGLVVHEIVGHAVPAYAFGARGLRIELHSDFSGAVRYGATQFTPWQTAVVDVGGIAVNLVTGFTALPVENRLRAIWLRRVVVLFGAISIYKALEYLTMSFFYGGPGDPLEHAPWCTVWHGKGYWIAPLLALPLAIAPFARALARVERLDWRRLAAVCAPTLALGGAFYYRASLLGTFDRAALDRAKAAQCHLDPKEVAAPFPVLPCIALLTAVGALAGARGRKKTTGAP